ncbi:MAG TPA: GNAT family N-acetyltransferase [Bacteroidia bacterium]|jgi:ribosomal-protein-alanine N-acetyltransferase|nr:GNAT family N-acetyltransferase [Bacteroidia bacterium]
MIKCIPFPTLETERLVLRQLDASDENEIFRLRSDEKVNEFLDRPKANTLDDAKRFIEKIAKGINNNENLYWAITLKNEKKLIGTICLWSFSLEKNSAEIGYELLPDFQGKGFMHEAIKAVVEYGFKTMKLDAIDAFTHPRNIKSIKIAERNGFVYEKETDDGVIYSLKNK